MLKFSTINTTLQKKYLCLRTFTELVVLSLTKNIPEETIKSGKRTSDIHVSGILYKNTLRKQLEKRETHRRDAEDDAIMKRYLSLSLSLCVSEG